MKATATEVEECFQQAIEIACRQGSKLLELRAVIRLSQLWYEEGKITCFRNGGDIFTPQQMTGHAAIEWSSGMRKSRNGLRQRASQGQPGG